MTSGVLYFYKCVVKRIIDGDTIDVVFDLGFDTSVKQRIRLYGINTPETRTRDKVEKQKGLAAKKGKYGRYLGSIYVPLKNHPHYVEMNDLRNVIVSKEKINEKSENDDVENRAPIFELVNLNEEMYINVNHMLLEENHAEEYFGGKR